MAGSGENHLEVVNCTLKLFVLQFKQIRTRNVYGFVFVIIFFYASGKIISYIIFKRLLYRVIQIHYIEIFTIEKL